MTIKQAFINSLLPPRETEILLAFLIKKPREFLLTHPETNISAATYSRFKNLSKKRLANWPIAYLTGHKEFYSLDFLVNDKVLVPRPETEMIVEEIIGQEENLPAKTTIIDIGTGSGAIIISLAKNLKKENLKKISFLAVDISPAALRIAGQNARRQGLAKIIKFYHGNLLAPLSRQLKGRGLIIAANLPYLTKSQIAASPSIKKEPRLALEGGKDGLKYYQELFKQLKVLGPKSLTLIGEISPEQKVKILKLAKQYFPKLPAKIKKDLSGKNRFFIISSN